MLNTCRMLIAIVLSLNIATAVVVYGLDSEAAEMTSLSQITLRIGGMT